MKTQCRYIGAQRTIDGELSLSFIVDNKCINELDSLADKELLMDVDIYRKKRSLNANNYFWKLCSEIAQKLGTDKETVYLMKLSDAGYFECIDVVEEAIDMLKPLFRLVEVDHLYHSFIYSVDGEEQLKTMASLRCYKGSHEFNTKEMSHLIDLTVHDAKELGISTMTPDEIAHMVSIWRQQ